MVIPSITVSSAAGTQLGKNVSRLDGGSEQSLVKRQWRSASYWY